MLVCTELPYLFAETRSPIPVYDTTPIHAENALDMAMADHD